MKSRIWLHVWGHHSETLLRNPWISPQVRGLWGRGYVPRWLYQDEGGAAGHNQHRLDKLFDRRCRTCDWVENIPNGILANENGESTGMAMMLWEAILKDEALKDKAWRAECHYLWSACCCDKESGMHVNSEADQLDEIFTYQTQPILRTHERSLILSITDVEIRYSNGPT